jgi:AcrR family transcriptional regulator
MYVKILIYMPRRTKEEALKTREALLDAAEKVFFARGVTRTSLEQVAQAAGVTRGAVYWHFKDKAALLDALTQRIFLPHEDMLEDLLATPSSAPLLDLKKACIHTLQMMAKDKRRREIATILFLRCEYTEEMLGIIARRNIGKNRLLTLMEKLFSNAKSLKTLAPWWTSRQAAVATQALMVGLILSGLEDRKNFNFSSVGVACVEAFFNSLQAS